MEKLSTLCIQSPLAPPKHPGNDPSGGHGAHEEAKARAHGAKRAQFSETPNMINLRDIILRGLVRHSVWVSRSPSLLVTHFDRDRARSLRRWVATVTSAKRGRYPSRGGRQGELVFNSAKQTTLCRRDQNPRSPGHDRRWAPMQASVTTSEVRPPAPRIRAKEHFGYIIGCMDVRTESIHAGLKQPSYG